MNEKFPAMYCAWRLSDPLSNLKYLSPLIELKFSRFGWSAVENPRPIYWKSFGICSGLRSAKTIGAVRVSLPLSRSHRSNFGIARGGKLAEQNVLSANQNLVALDHLKDLRNCATFSAMGVDDETGLARRLWTKYKKESTFAMYNPFFVALAAGTLSIESFRNYMAQDAYFLKAFIQAYTMAEECADDDDDKSTIGDLRKAAEEELKLHDSLAEAWDVEFTKEFSPNTATVKYTDFLLATAAGKVEGGKGPSRSVTPFEKTKIAAYTVGAMTPCMRLYAFLGQEILKVLGDECADHPYKHWIETYSSATFEAEASQIEELLDKLAISLTGEELEVLGKLYHQALKLELQFFSAQPLSQRTSVPVLKVGDPATCQYTIVSDFDLSCTIMDSSAILAEIAILTTQKAEQNGPENSTDCKLSSDLRSSWDMLCSQYSDEYECCLSKILPSEEGSFDYEGLCRSLEQLSQFEVEANSKVVESALLQGINIEDIKKAGERLALQEGCTNFFKQALSKMDGSNVDVHILSVCWSGDIIRAAFSSSGLNGVRIHSNELTFVESISTGNIDRHVESPMDKLKTFNDILSSTHDDSMEHISVYIGDSLGDLLCLLQANIGIVIGSSSNLRRVGKCFGVSFVPLFSGLLKKERAYGEGSNCWTRQTGILYTVSSWSEIHALLLGSN